MSEETWESVKKLIGRQSLLLGSNFAHQAIYAPRHLLFVLSRYKFAARMLPQGKMVKVLELGCGEGLGTMMLAEGGNQVTAVDGDEDAVRHAQETLAGHGVDFRIADFLGRSFGAFDAVVSLDVIEHIPQDKEDLFFDTVRSNLSEHGFCVIGTPNLTAAKYASKSSQLGHINLYDAERLTGLVRRHFHNVFLFGMNDEVAHTGFYAMCHYLMVLGCAKVGPEGGS
jgi:2-polyprenyl-3-methyl-5-hydroxy-6-metoxy-1,4-benzoquinol methylase